MPVLPPPPAPPPPWELPSPPTPALPPPPEPRRRRGAARVAVALLLSVALIASLGVVGTLRRDARGPSDAELAEERAILRQRLPGLREDVERLRGLRFERDVPVRLVRRTAAELRRYDRAGGLPSGTPSSDVLEVFGLPPDPYASPAGARPEALAYYDPTTETATIFADRLSMHRTDGMLAVVHELAHGLADQHFGLWTPARGGDSLNAFRALVEGDATLVEHLWLEEETGGAPYIPTAGSAGDWHDELDVFPYDDGYRFLRALYDRGGWDEVNRAWDEPPTTTEQVLHPDRYPSASRFPPGLSRPLFVPPANYNQFVEEGQVGELFLRALLRPGPEGAVAAADGWRSGRFRAYRTPSGEGVVLVTVLWATPADIGEFEDALIAWARDRFGLDTFDPIGGRVRLTTHERCLDVGGDPETLLVTFALFDDACW